MLPNRPNINDMQTAIPLRSIQMYFQSIYIQCCSIHYHQYLNAVGYRSTVAVFKIFDAVPLAIRRVRRNICNHGILTNVQAIPQAPLPANIETVSIKQFYST